MFPIANDTELLSLTRLKSHDWFNLDSYKMLGSADDRKYLGLLMTETISNLSHGVGERPILRWCPVKS